jgi:hypothetical protein
MHSSAGPTRYDFLDPLIGVCLRYRSTMIIDNHDKILGAVWEKPSSFVEFGNGFLQGTPEKDRILYIAETFKFLKSLMDSQRKITLHLKTNRENKWQMIRGYAFHFWLERVNNQKIKSRVHQLCLGCDQSSKQQQKNPTSTTMKPCNVLVPGNKTNAANSKLQKTTPSRDAGTRINDESTSGLIGLLTTRRMAGYADASHCTWTKS